MGAPTMGRVHHDDGNPVRPSLEESRAVFVISPFTRLARVHAFSIGGDALFTIGLAGTVFFDTDLDEARWKVALTLILTILPFAAATPLIGPALDRIRGGRRAMILFTCLGRAFVCLLLGQNFENLAFYPLAFCMLVLGKSYQIAKSALVPTTVRNDAELVEANSKLSLLSGLAVVVAAVPGGLFWKFGGPDWVLGLAAVVFVVGAVLAFRLPSARVALAPPDDVERQELRSVAILLAAIAMGVMRGIVGFVSFLLAFDYKSDGAWKLGVIAITAQAGFLVGAALAPRLRKLVEEEYILIGVLLTTVVTSIGAAFTGGLFVASLMSFTVGAGSSAGKQAFDSIVQRDAPDANRGRSFARFETMFQLLWVVGALIPVAISIPAQAGFALMAAAAAGAAASYWMGLRSASLRAASLVRAFRRRQRREADLELSRDLGFGTGIDPHGPRQASRRERRSAAAREAERRRHEHDQAAAPPGPEVPDEVAPLLDDTGPDLDWHPEY